MVNENNNGVDVVSPDDCGNAPRRLLLVNMYNALANKDEEFLRHHVMTDVVWEVIGKQNISGLSELITFFHTFKENKLLRIEIDTVLTHGRYGAVNGIMTFQNHSIFGFCDVYTFSSASKSGKVKQVSSYVIKKE